MTWFGGIWFVASAVRVNDNTMTIRANDVIKIKILGASESTVKINNSFMDVETFDGSLSEKIEIKSVIVYRSPVLSIAPIPRYALFEFLSFDH